MSEKTMILVEAEKYGRKRPLAIRNRPEIRVHCSPDRVGLPGKDYHMVFETFRDAERYIGITPAADRNPVVAIGGYEFNLWKRQTVQQTSKKETNVINGGEK